jgi:NADPH-dependent 7-cyano-7-deazaguanine reductase QueF
MRIKNFKDFITSLKQVTAYTPEESNITIASLEAYATSLTNTNKAVDTTYNDYSKALQLRDTLLYHPETGVVELSKKLKSYLKSVKDISASDKQEAAAIPFKAPAKKDLLL